MNSGIQNISGAYVEKLDLKADFVTLENDSGNLVINPGSASYTLKRSTLYQINRVILIQDLIANFETREFAFPKWEQFALRLKIQAYLANSNGDRKRTLWEQMRWYTPDGVTNYIEFVEPFVFQSLANEDSLIVFTFEDDGSIYVNIAGMKIPPTAGQVIDIEGMISLEGFSLPIDTSSVIKTDQGLVNVFQDQKQCTIKHVL